MYFTHILLLTIIESLERVFFLCNWVTDVEDIQPLNFVVMGIGIFLFWYDILSCVRWFYYFTVKVTYLASFLVLALFSKDFLSSLRVASIVASERLPPVHIFWRERKDGIKVFCFYHGMVPEFFSFVQSHNYIFRSWTSIYSISVKILSPPPCGSRSLPQLKCCDTVTWKLPSEFTWEN